MRNYYLGIFVTLALSSCNNDESKPISRFEREKQEALAPSPALDPSTLTDKEKEFFIRLTPVEQNIFSTFTKQQRSWALELTEPVSSDEAIWKSAMQEILELEPKMQNFYIKLNQQNKLIFLILDQEPTESAFNYAETMSPNRAIHEALKLEIDTFPNNLQQFINHLPDDEKARFLSLSDTSQAKIYHFLEDKNYTRALELATEIDIHRLPQDEQAFIKTLSKNEQTIFLSLPPEGRWMAIALTKKLDFNLALEYAASIQTVQPE